MRNSWLFFLDDLHTKDVFNKSLKKMCETYAETHIFYFTNHFVFLSPPRTLKKEDAHIFNFHWKKVSDKNNVWTSFLCLEDFGFLRLIPF